MITQTDLFIPPDEIVDSAEIEPEKGPVEGLKSSIAVPCGFRNRYNEPCRRLGNWPVMADGKQLSCRGRPMVHCDPACLKGDASVGTGDMDDEDVDWEGRLGSDGYAESD